MINRGIEWFEKQAKLIWKSDPAKSILTIVPSGYDTDQVAQKITKFIETSFLMHTGDENHTPIVLPVIPDRHASAEQLVMGIIKQAEKHLEDKSQAHTDDYLSDKVETVFEELLENELYPVLLIKRFNSFTRIVDEGLLPILSSLREFERENKVTSIVISPMNYDVIREKLRENPGQSYAFLNSPYGDNHEKIVAEPLGFDTFIKYASSQGMDISAATELFADCGGPDKIYEVAIRKKLNGTGSLIDDCLEECSPVLKDLLEHCEILNNTNILIQLADENLSEEEVAHLVSKDLQQFLLKKTSNQSYACSSGILKKTILNLVESAKKDIFDRSIHIFDRSIKELLLIDETQEIEFKETFFEPSKTGEGGKDVGKDVLEPD